MAILAGKNMAFDRTLSWSSYRKDYVCRQMRRGYQKEHVEVRRRLLLAEVENCRHHDVVLPGLSLIYIASALANSFIVSHVNSHGDPDCLTLCCFGGQLVSLVCAHGRRCARSGVGRHGMA